MPPEKVVDNFYGNLQKLNQYYALFDNIAIIDTSNAAHQILATCNNGNTALHISIEKLPLWYKQYLPNLYSKD